VRRSHGTRTTLPTLAARDAAYFIAMKGRHEKDAIHSGTVADDSRIIGTADEPRRRPLIAEQTPDLRCVFNKYQG